MKFVLIMWFVSKSAISVTSAQFETVDLCREALTSVQAQLRGEAIQVGGEQQCNQALVGHVIPSMGWIGCAWPIFCLCNSGTAADSLAFTAAGLGG